MMAVKVKERRARTDWFRILADLNQAGMPNYIAAHRIGVSPGALRGWKVNGAEPAHDTGERLLRLWAERCRPELEPAIAVTLRPLVIA